MDISQLKRKEISCYKPSDLWSQADDLLFLKWVTNKRCYHTKKKINTVAPTLFNSRILRGGTSIGT